MVGYGVVFPVLPVFTRSFGVSTFAAGAVVSAFALTKLATTPWCARLIQAVGAKTSIGLGSGLVALSSAACGLAQNYWQLLVSRGAAGIGSAFFSVAAMSLLLAKVPAELRGRASATFSGGFLIGAMVGPAIGGVLTEISIRAPFFFYAFTLFLALLVALAMLDSGGGPVAAEHTNTTLGTLLHQPAFLVVCSVSFAIGWQAQGARSTLVPIQVVEDLGQAASASGVIFAIAAVAQGLALTPAGRITDTLGRKPMVIGGLLLGAVATVGIALASSMVLLTIAMCVFGVAAAALSTGSTALLGDVTRGRGGHSVAFFQACQDVGAIIGPLVVGSVADNHPLWFAFVIGAVIMAAAALLAAMTGFPATKQESATNLES